MEGRGHAAWLHTALPPARLNEYQFFVPADLFFDSDPSVELEQVGAAPQQDVLAIVDDFARAGMFVGRGAPAQIGTPLQERYTIAGLGQRTTRRQSRQSCSDHRDGFAHSTIRRH